MTATTIVPRLHDEPPGTGAATRDRIVGHLHDYPMQDIVCALMQLELVREQGKNETGASSRPLDQCERALRDAACSLRRIIDGTAPVDVDVTCFGDEIRSMCDRFEHQYGIHVDAGNLIEALPPTIAQVALRALRETLCNCCKHAGAETVRVLAGTGSHGAMLMISDNGCGFPEELACTDVPPPNAGTGLRLMLASVREIGGGYTFMSSPGSGTTVVFHLPPTVE